MFCVHLTAFLLETLDARLPLRAWTNGFTTELLELLWVLEATVVSYPEQSKTLEAVVAGPCFLAEELPLVPEDARKPPPAPSDGGPKQPMLPLAAEQPAPYPSAKKKRP